MSLSSNFNVYNTCLRILRVRGFELHVEGELSADGCYPADAVWIAEKAGFRFMAHNPIELLGLAAIYDHVQPAENRSYWWLVEGADIWDELMEKAFPHTEENIEELRPGLTPFPQHVFVDDQPWLSDYLWPLLSIDLGILRSELAGTTIHMLRPVGPIDGYIGDNTVKFHNEFTCPNWFALHLTEDNRYRFLGQPGYFEPYSKSYAEKFKESQAKVLAYAQEHGRLAGFPRSLDGKALEKNWLDILGGDFWAGNWITEKPPSAFNLLEDEEDGYIELSYQGKPFFPVAYANNILLFYEPESRTTLFTFDYS